jgi:hypothetical protein
MKEETLTSRNVAQRDRSAKARQGQMLGFLASRSDFVPLAGRPSAPSELFPGLDRMGWPAGSGLDSGRGGCQFSEEDQIQKRSTRKMLKMKVDPTMLLKTKFSNVTNCVIANICMKTNRLSMKPLCY